MKSCLYEGRVRHRRFGRDVPGRTAAGGAAFHEFEYRTAYLYLDLGELDSLAMGRLLWSSRRAAPVRFRREDHLGDPAVPLDTSVRDLVERRLGRRPAGPVRLLTQPRVLGYGFNPVSFFYCLDAAEQTIEAAVAEVTNTPWGERHCYVLAPSAAPAGGRVLHCHAAKMLHVSPFMGMELTYDFHLALPGERLALRIRNLDGGRRLFEASMALARTPLSATSLARAVLLGRLLPLGVITAIHWQALRLWLGGASYHPHRPAAASSSCSATARGRAT